MDKETKQQIKQYGCKVDDGFHKSVSNISQANMWIIKHILENKGYEIIDARSSETTLTYKTSPKLFRQIVDEYDMTDIFQAIRCFAEISELNETSQMGSGAEFSQSNECGFYMCIDFAHHKVEKIHFGDERTIQDYNRRKCFIDEVECSEIEKKILETIWTLEEERERIRHLGFNEAPKKVVEYRKLLKQWDKVLNVISEDWKQSTLVFGKRYAIERDIEYWENYIRRETAKLVL